MDDGKLVKRKSRPKKARKKNAVDGVVEQVESPTMKLVVRALHGAVKGVFKDETVRGNPVTRALKDAMGGGRKRERSDDE